MFNTVRDRAKHNATATLGGIARGNDATRNATRAMPPSLRAHSRGHVSSELGVAIGCK